MDDLNGDLSEETLDFCSSINSSLGGNMSMYGSSFNSSLMILNFYEHSKELPEKNDIVQIPEYEENSLSCTSKHLECLSLDFTFNSKLREIKQLLSETKSALFDWKITDIALKTYIKCEYRIPSQLASKMKEVLEAYAVMKSSYVKNKSGEIYHILGLENEDIELMACNSLSAFEKSELSKHAMVVMKDNIEKFNAQRKHLQGEFGNHCQKVVQPDSLLSEKREQQAIIFRDVQDQVDQARRLLISINHKMQQLTHMPQISTQDLYATTFFCLCDKARYLHTIVSVLNLKMKLSVIKDENYTRAMNTLADDLKTSVDDFSEKLKSLQSALNVYKKKEDCSIKFKEVISEYAKTKRQLQFKYQILNVLNDPECGFS